MNGFEIGIVGGTGGIGRWFAGFFRREGYQVHVTGRSAGMPLPELAARCRVVIVAVPIAATGDVIRAAGPLLPADSLLMDMTSLKEAPIREMLVATEAEVLGCHPLFGPSCPSLAGQNIVLCPARGDGWLGAMEALFTKNGARVTIATPEEHDRMMALVQGLNHIETILMGLALRDSGVEASTFEAFSTPAFRTKRAICEKVFGAPELYAGLLAGNPYLPEIIERCERNISLLKGLVLSRDAEGLAALMGRPETGGRKKQT